MSFSVYVRGGILIPQIQRLQAQAKANIAANAATYNAWVKSHTPLQIRDANSARLTLSRLGDKNYPPIKDERMPKIPKSAYILYLTERIDAHGYRGKPGTETFTAIAHEWNDLPQSEKDVRTLGRIDIYRIAGTDYESSATTNCKLKIAIGMRKSTRRCTEPQHASSLGINHRNPIFQPESEI